MGSLVVTMRLKTKNPELVKELIESNGCSLPGLGQNVFHGRDSIACITELEIREEEDEDSDKT
jgi:hypothetical protein